MCPSFTFYATAEAIASIGAVPVFCDIDPATFCVTAETVRPAVTPRTKAIVPVHLFGNVAPMEGLREFGLPLVEDAAQAAGATLGGARAGALGDAATFSFFPSKNLPCLGDGGAVTTDDDDVAKLVRRLRFHGSDDKKTFVEVGYNSRLDELQAAALRVLLPELDGWNAAAPAAAERVRAPRARRARTASRDDPRRGARLPPLRRPPRAGRRPRGAARRRRHRGARLLPRADPRAARDGARSHRGAPLPGTAEAARTHLALPMGPVLGEDGVREVVAACASG